MSNTFAEWFWQDSFWLPKNITWNDLKTTKSSQFAKPSDIYMVLPYSLLLYLLRLLVERFIAKPLGIKLNISNIPCKKPPDNILLEKVFLTVTKHPEHERLQGICKQLGWSEYKVLQWFKRKRDINRPTKLVKFQETVWRFLLYTFLFIFGNVTLAETSPKCLTQPRTCWKGYPDKQQLNFLNYWYFQVELSFYTSCAFSQFFDVKRKDFWPMCIHHCATILLIAFSYSINMLNIGTVIMVLHDFSDIFLELSKLVKYAKCEKLATVGFISFGFSFFIARIIYFPFWILKSVWFDCFDVVGPFPSYYVFCFCLLLLQVLHVYWITFIISGLIAFIKNGGDVDDARSESEVTDTDTEVEILEPTNLNSGDKAVLRKKNR